MFFPPKMKHGGGIKQMVSILTVHSLLKPLKNQVLQLHNQQNILIPEDASPTSGPSPPTNLAPRKRVMLSKYKDYVVTRDDADIGECR